MLQRHLVLLSLFLGGTAFPAAVAPDDLPQFAEGVFVQRKILADVDVALASSGTFRFEKGRSFEFKTLQPVPSTFLATPTNYTMTVRGKSTTRALNVDVSSLEKIFEIREIGDFVREVKVAPEKKFPERVRVFFKNGDRLEIDLKRTDAAGTAP
ncbi:MAG: hypothetical protein ACI4Q3_08895 [Kiritimatiellia bacterium]